LIDEAVAFLHRRRTSRVRNIHSGDLSHENGREAKTLQ
jgi:hypothetical protein